jgi:hypothetical protein
LRKKVPADWLELLRRFEPVLRFTRGERFFPMDVARYVENSSLWIHRPNQPAERLYADGELSLERLSEPRFEPFDSVQHIKFIEPLNITQLARYQLRQTFSRKNRKEAFHAGPGRLARVGYGSRLLDAIFSLSLFARGRVPGDTAAAAAVTYERIQQKEARYVYHGRVIEQDGWLALQYWYFYPFNNWRSGFNGVNDHEADWEMVCLYLHRGINGEWQPEWAAYASHDFEGDELRRRWDDPELERVGEHPIVYVGAGSHASYYQAGEYLTELELPLLSPIVAFFKQFNGFWDRLIGGKDNRGQSPTPQVFRIPFVDYARGEGTSIGFGQQKEWSQPELLTPPPKWVTSYRGLWGLWARDPIMGENAPGGPMYDRFGRVRRAWYDPIGWAGLDKQVAPDKALEKARLRQRAIAQRQHSLAISIKEKSRELHDLGMEAEAIQELPHLKRLHASIQTKIRSVSVELDGMRSQLAADDSLLEALDLYAERLAKGFKRPARAHLIRAHHPTSALSLRLGRIAEVWAAASIGIMLIAFVAIALFARHYLLVGLVSLFSMVAIVEAVFRRNLGVLISYVTNTLAIVAGLVLLFEFFWEIVIGLVLIAGAYIMWENLRELWS